MCFYRADFPNPLRLDDRMGAIVSPEVHNRTDLVGRLYSEWASQKVPSVLQSVSMATRHDVESVSLVGNPSFRADGNDRSAVDDTLCHKRGLTLYGAGMHHYPLISSRVKPLVNWGHDWVLVTLLISCLPWAPTKV